MRIMTEITCIVLLGSILSGCAGCNIRQDRVQNGDQVYTSVQNGKEDTDTEDKVASSLKEESGEDSIQDQQQVDEGAGNRFKQAIEQEQPKDEIDLLLERMDIPQKGTGDQAIVTKEFNYSDYNGDRDLALKEAFAYGDSGNGWYIVENIRNPYDGVSDEVIVRIVDN